MSVSGSRSLVSKLVAEERRGGVWPFMSGIEAVLEVGEASGGCVELTSLTPDRHSGYFLDQ